VKLNWAERLVVNNPVRVMIQRLLIRWIKGVIRLTPQARVLEIGCGRGAGARRIQAEFHPARLHASDLDHRMILKAQRYLQSGGRDQIALFVADACWLPYRDAALDAVFGFGVLHHVPDWRGALREIARVLKPGGIYVLEEFYPPFYQNCLARRLFLHPEHDRFDSRALHQALQETGFALQDRLEQKLLGLLAVAVKGE
jgi:ubiquinone/menaquinone biosynthesis C-methylase UbiE